MATEQSELDLSYGMRYQDVKIPEAYERLILDTYAPLDPSAKFVCNAFSYLQVSAGKKSSFLSHGLFTSANVCFDRIRGDQQHFVRRDELRVCDDLPYMCTSFAIGSLVNNCLTRVFCCFQAAWEIFTPLLHDIDAGKLKSVSYKPGTRGPQEADEMSRRMGYVQTHGYIWVPPTLAKF